MQHRVLAGVLLLSVAGCGAEAASHETRTPGARVFSLTPVAELDDGDARILARPEWVSILPDGSVVVADISDQNLKLYDTAGVRISTVGRVGHGPGEFVGLTTGQGYRDSLVAFDMNGSRLSFFAPDGRFARALVVRRRGLPRAYHTRVVDDSLLLLVGAVPGNAGNDLLALLRGDGTPVSTFFNPASSIGTDPSVIQRLGVVADAVDGVAFAALTGGDSIHAFDYAGRRLGSGPADPDQPIVTTRELLRRAGGVERDGAGTVFTHGNRNIIGLVALDSATVAVQIARYDAVQGTDPVDGGTMVVAALHSDGTIRPIARAEVEGALLGRDREGRLLVLQYASPNADSYRLLRLILDPTETGTGR